MFTVRYLNWCTVIWNIFIQERCFIGSSSYAKKHFRRLSYNTLLHWRIILAAFFMLEFHKFIAKFILQVFVCSCWYVFSVIFCIISNVRVLSTEKTCVLVLCLKLLYTHIDTVLTNSVFSIRNVANFNETRIQQNNVRCVFRTLSNTYDGVFLQKWLAAFSR